MKLDKFEKYNSQLELRNSRLSAPYKECLDNDDPDERMQCMMA